MDLTCDARFTHQSDINLCGFDHSKLRPGVTHREAYE